MSDQQHKTRLLTLGGLASAGALALMSVAVPASAGTEVDEPDTFTSAFTVMATPEEVVDNGDEAPGEPGAAGEFTFRVNSDLEIICYDITLTGVTGDYESPAKTATHVHDAALGEGGPPRLAFPDPMPVGDEPRTSSGCMQGPFTTGLEDDDGNDTGEGFSLAELEGNAAAFSADSHTENFVPGVVRGQLTQVPVAGPETGGGGTAESSGATAPLIGAGALAMAGAAGFVVYRRREQTTS